MVCIETELARRAYGHAIEVSILKRFCRVGGRVMAAYLVLKIVDVTVKGQWGYVFANTMQSNLYLVEILLGIVLPILLIFSPAVNKRWGLLLYALLTVGGIIMNRMNCVFTAMYKSGAYFPSVWEILVSVGLIAAGCLVYCFIVENFHVIGDSRAVHRRVQKDLGSGHD